MVMNDSVLHSLMAHIWLLQESVPNPTDPLTSWACGTHVPERGSSFLCDPDHSLSPKTALR